jgi:transposase
VFATVEGTVGFRWYLGVFHAAAVVVVVLAPGRAHDVPGQYLGPQATGIRVVDRSKASQAIGQVTKGLIVLAFCRAHVRRDFGAVARPWPDPEGWALGWVERIGQVEQRNDARRAVREGPAKFAVADQRRRGAVTALAGPADGELADPELHPARRRVREGRGDHGTGLTVFVEPPEVPRDHNTAGRAQRGPVVGRKHSSGSGAVGAGRLAALLFALRQTLCLGGLNPRAWRTAYRTACAAAGGAAPAEGERFLPWTRSEQQRRCWSLAGTADEVDTS